MLKSGIMLLKGKICRILRRWHAMNSIKKSARCIFLQKKYDKHKIELPTNMPASGILGIKIYTANAKNRSDEYNEFKIKK